MLKEFQNTYSVILYGASWCPIRTWDNKLTRHFPRLFSVLLDTFRAIKLVHDQFFYNSFQFIIILSSKTPAYLNELEINN
jgi:hypothetical protein